MDTLKILNTREIKDIKARIKSQWDADFVTDYAFLRSIKDKLFIVNRDIGDFDFSKLNIKGVGLYFGEFKVSEIRLSIEGSGIVGPLAKKNIIDIDEKNLEIWMKGEDIAVENKDITGFVIIKNKNDFLGCGKYKEGRILNYVPKERRAYIF